jgi:hypothetical protein
MAAFLFASPLDVSTRRIYIHLNKQRGDTMQANRPGRNIRLSDEEWADFKSLLGAQWLRGQIKKAKARKMRADKPEAVQ